MKNHRDVCKARDAGFISFEGLPGRVKTGCQRTPGYNSRYCSLHKPRVCSLIELPEEDGTVQTATKQRREGVIERILEKKCTRNTTYFKVCIVLHLS